MSGVESGPPEPEFNPLRYPPCACPLHRAEREPEQETDQEPRSEPGEDSPPCANSAPASPRRTACAAGCGDRRERGVEYLAEVHAGSGAVRFFLGGTLAPTRRLALRWLRRQAHRFADGLDPDPRTAKVPAGCPAARTGVRG